MHKYILNANGDPEVCDDFHAWGKWFETADRHVALDKVGDVTVSTVFLGLDHSFGAGAPLLFETMIFGGQHDDYCDRYATRAEAVEGHMRALALVYSHASA